MIDPFDGPPSRIAGSALRAVITALPDKIVGRGHRPNARHQQWHDQQKEAQPAALVIDGGNHAPEDNCRTRAAATFSFGKSWNSFQWHGPGSLVACQHEAEQACLEVGYGNRASQAVSPVARRPSRELAQSKEKFRRSVPCADMKTVIIIGLFCLLSPLATFES